jgi:hypothetical protein
MNDRLKGVIFRWLGKAKVVPIAECVHFCAFRYGCGYVNPYEEYAKALVRREPLTSARQRFVAFLQHYRPRDFGSALGVRLSRNYALWQFPWERGARPEGVSASAWLSDPDDVPDIITHFSERGISRYRIDEEFLWAEKLFHSIEQRGFKTRAFERPVEVQEFAAVSGDRRYLILDGNHRVSALSARGEKEVKVYRTRLAPVCEAELADWPAVKGGSYSQDDARRLFQAYFIGNQCTRTTEIAAPILEHNAPEPAR